MQCALISFTSIANNSNTILVCRTVHRSFMHVHTPYFDGVVYLTRDDSCNVAMRFVPGDFEAFVVARQNNQTKMSGIQDALGT